MTVWLRVRAVSLLFGLFVFYFVFALVVGNRTANVPTVLGGGTGTVAYSLLVPMALATGVIYCFDTRGCAEELNSRRSVWHLDCGLFLLCLVLVAAAGEVLNIGGSSLVDNALVRSTFILLGLGMMVGSWVAAEVAVFVPVLVLLFTTSWPTRSPLAPYVKVLQHEAEPVWSWALALTTPVLAVLFIWMSAAVWISSRRLRPR